MSVVDMPRVIDAVGLAADLFHDLVREPRRLLAVAAVGDVAEADRGGVGERGERTEDDDHRHDRFHDREAPLAVQSRSGHGVPACVAVIPAFLIDAASH